MPNSLSKIEIPVVQSSIKRTNSIQNYYKLNQKYPKVPKITQKNIKISSAKKYSKVPKSTKKRKKYHKVPRSTKKYQEVAEN